MTPQGLQVCKSILNHNSYDFAAHRIGLRVVRKSDALNDLKQLQGVFELPADALPPTITIGKGKTAKNDWYAPERERDTTLRDRLLVQGRYACD